jgi:hypothetical protein
MAVMSYLHTMVKGKRLHGTHGMHGLKRLLFLEIATKHRSYDSSPPQHKQLSFYILSVLHTKQFAYGDKKLLYVKWKPKALRTGVGRSKMIFGKCFGQNFRQLLRVANNL